MRLLRTRVKCGSVVAFQRCDEVELRRGTGKGMALVLAAHEAAALFDLSPVVLDAQGVEGGEGGMKGVTDYGN